MGLTYRDAGVDIDAGNRAVQMIKGLARGTFRPEVVTDIGHFGGMFALGRYQEPVLVSSVDGVGTKLKIAFVLDKHDTIGIDLVNHCVNDILACGAEALFFMDYLAAARVIPEQVASVVKGLSDACRGAGCGRVTLFPIVYQDVIRGLQIVTDSMGDEIGERNKEPTGVSPPVGSTLSLVKALGAPDPKAWRSRSRLARVSATLFQVVP